MKIPTAALFAPLLALTLTASASAHCDTVDGPVVAAARAALASGDVAPVLAWIQPADEAAIRQSFVETLAVRSESEAARALADRYFFETLVRIHRAGEGVAYTGLLPAGTPIAPAIVAADAALESGNVDALVGEITSAVAAGIRERFAAARIARAHATHNVEAGRQFVASYVALTHYVEAIEGLAAGHGGHSEGAAEGHDAPAHAHDAAR